MTIVGKQLYSVSISKNNNGIYGDWRKQSKDNLDYKVIDLPPDVESNIHRLMGLLNLTFGGMDLIMSNGNYYFIEVNPTGEWGWLNECFNPSIDTLIVDHLETK